MSEYDYSPEVKQAEVWAAELGTADWLLNATRVAKKWGLGRELTRQQFEEATHEVANYQYGLSYPEPVK